MKQKIISLILLVISISIMAQSPNKISYQAVVRNSNNNIVIDQNIKIRISILQGSLAGSQEYIEIHNTTTNSYGIASIEIGGGIVQFGQFAFINWSNGPFFIKTDIDLTGGSNYTISGITQMLSVPFALYSNYANVAATSNDLKKHYIGEKYGGGIVFFIYDNGLHGLIAAENDQVSIGNGAGWFNGTFSETLAKADGFGAGKSNTAIVVSQTNMYTGHNPYAALVCNNFSITVDNITYGDWYLPSKYELNLLYLQKDITGCSDGTYWSSTEIDTQNAWSQSFIDGEQKSEIKHNGFLIRAIRSF